MKKRILALSLAATMTAVLAVPAFAATSINISDSTEDTVTDTLDKTTGTSHFAADENYDGPVGSPTNVWDNGSIVEEVKVTAVKTADFTITIPKEIVMDGANATADYEVNVKGDIAGDQQITVTPAATFNLNEAGGKGPEPVTVTQPDNTFAPNEIYYGVDKTGLGKTVQGSLAAPTLSAGQWSGKFNFNIVYQ